MGWMDTMTTILSQLEQKCAHVDHLFSLTNDLEKAVLSGNSDGIGLILELRQEDIDEVQRLDEQIKKNVALLPNPLQRKMQDLLSPEAGDSKPDNPLESVIFDTHRRIVITMRKLVTFDAAIRSKIQKN